jgi:pimeloyl-ACP methyl ester carboxylesterase
MLGDLESLQGRLEPANAAYGQALALLEDSPGRQRLGNKLHRSSTIVRAGGRVVYYEHGVGEPTLVLCHPAVYGIATFQDLLEQLCQEFRIVTWDPRGTGMSDPLPGPYYITDFMKDLRDVIEAIGNRPVVVIGQSRGSSLAVHFTATYPHLVTNLILAGLSPGAGGRDVPHADRLDMEYLGRLRSTMAAEDWPAIVRIFITQVCAGEPGCQKLVEGWIPAWTQLPLETLKNFLGLDDPGRDVRPLLPILRVPTLVLHGETDRIAPVEMGRWTAEQIPGAQFYALKGRCHAAPFTAPAEFAEVVRHFIRTGRPT